MSTDRSCCGMSSIQPVKKPGFLVSHVIARTMNDIITITSANLQTYAFISAVYKTNVISEGYACDTQVATNLIH